MPELAEVEYYRRQWDEGMGSRIRSVIVSGQRSGRMLDAGTARELETVLPGRILRSSFASGKQLAFVFSGGVWLGLHLGMTGSLSTGASDQAIQKHDHLVLMTAKGSLRFSDPRRFGRILLHVGEGEPKWWANRPRELLSREFTPAELADILRRRAASRMKPLLLDQAHFPGIGNWMADEVLWRCGIHPMSRAGSVEPERGRRLWRTLRCVCRDALRVIAPDWGDPPDAWLFNHRWRDGGTCPRCHATLQRESIGGRTTCWCPECQK